MNERPASAAERYSGISSRPAAFSAHVGGQGIPFGPGHAYVEKAKALALRADERIEAWPVLDVGQAEALEMPRVLSVQQAGRHGLWGDSREGLARAERPSDACLDDAEHQQCETDDADEGGDAVIVVEEERPNAERLLGIPMSQFDHELVYLKDVLLRVATHPQSRIAELTPTWAQAQAAAAATPTTPAA